MHRIAGWWDALELWVAGLPFVPQVMLVLAVMVPVSCAIAWLLDRGLMAVLQLIGRTNPDASAATTTATPSGGTGSTSEGVR